MKNPIEQRLKELRNMRDKYDLVDAGFDWVRSEIAQLERIFYGKEVTLNGYQL